VQQRRPALESLEYRDRTAIPSRKQQKNLPSIALRSTKARTSGQADESAIDRRRPSGSMGRN
jgi:hypothetical protein